MNLADITTKCYILALIIRDDGERLLLGDGAYEFKDSQQHFIANTYANDVVELQGTDGQMLAGQVRRTATQTFAGYIGDATFSKQAVESARRDFLMFFRKKHYYTAVYVFSDGTAIQRDRGYIVNAPSAPELYQRYPEWSIGLNFEDPNYYEYAEDDLGHEIAAHKVELELSTAMSGGLIWDGDGAVSDDLSYVGTEIPGEGKNFQLADTGTATLKSAELLGDAEQNGTPTPDTPQAVNIVTGEQTVKIEGKNLFKTNRTLGTPSDTAYTNTTKRLFNYDEYVKGLSNTNYYSTTNVACSVLDDVLTVTPSAGGYGAGFAFSALPSTNYALSFNVTNASQSVVGATFYESDGTFISTTILNNATLNFTTPANCRTAVIVFRPNANQTCDYSNIQLELGSTATAYQPYQGQEFEVNLGKNLIYTGDRTNQGITFAYNATTGETSVSGTASTTYANALQISEYLPAGTYTLSIQDTLPFTVGIGTRNSANTRTPHGITAGNKTLTFTLTEPAFSYDVYLTALTSGSQINSTFKLQCEKGSSASSFAPYFTPIELAKIGDYQDYIFNDNGTWKIHKEVGKTTFKGSGATPEEWWANDGSGNAYIKIEEAKGTSSIPIYSNYFTYNQSASLWGEARFGGSNNNFIIMKGITQNTDLAGFKTWLSTHPTTVYYALATPTTTEITNSELVGQLERLRHAHTYADITNFSIMATSPNLPAYLKVVAFGDDAIPQGGYVWEDGGTGGATIITVDGVDNAQPIWTVVGPATNPSLTNITTGESIQWTGVVPNGQTLVVNMADMTASLSGANVFEFISGSWITLQAGNNRVSYSATAATGIATLEWNGVVG